jgi:hypothetical protein
MVPRKRFGRGSFACDMVEEMKEGLEKKMGGCGGRIFSAGGCGVVGGAKVGKHSRGRGWMSPLRY